MPVRKDKLRENAVTHREILITTVDITWSLTPAGRTCSRMREFTHARTPADIKACARRQGDVT